MELKKAEVRPTLEQPRSHPALGASWRPVPWARLRQREIQNTDETEQGGEGATYEGGERLDSTRRRIHRMEAEYKVSINPRNNHK